MSRKQSNNGGGRITPMKNFNDTFENRTRDLPACVEAPRPTAPRRDVPNFSHICSTFTLISSPLSHLVRNKYHKDPYHTIFSSLALLPYKLLYILLWNILNLWFYATAWDRFEPPNKNTVPRHNFIYLMKTLTPDSYWEDYVRGCIQNIPDWCHHLYSSCGSAKHR
jgi:hypothetical protein